MANVERKDDATPALETRSLNKRYGALVVAQDIDFSLRRGARHALIGPNGAGKTTFVNLLTGRVPPSSGMVLLQGEDISSLPVYRRVQRGLARTFQINTLLRSLSVLENVQLSVIEARRGGTIMMGGSRLQREAAERALQLLEQLGLADDANKPVRDLAYGRQRLVEIATALALEPAVLLLDEPSAGVPPADFHLVYDTISALPAEISVLMIEHDMKLVFRFAERISVLVQGKILREGSPDDIVRDELVRQVYLGHRKHD
jgi:branched-chain amino acid transport system ATP-binding protein